MLRWLRYGVFTLVVLVLLASPGAAPDTMGFGVYRLAHKDYFNVAGWMARKLIAEVSASRASPPQAGRNSTNRDEVVLVERYLELNKEIAIATPRSGSRNGPADPDSYHRLLEERDRLEPEAQAILRRQLEAVLEEEGFTARFAGFRGVFPPPLFAFTALPRMLIVSPRDQIRVDTSLPLKPGLTWTEAEVVEERTSAMDVSALVVPIGGLGAYPPMIPRTSSLEFLAKTLPHEWAHNYFTLRPLGFRYALQAEADYQVRTMNESAAGIIGEEIGDRILNRYYGYPEKKHPREPERRDESQGAEAPEESDFARRMRSIRLKVDELLAKGQVAQAEEHMQEQQKRLQADGYDVRKLNQAYFAFYGSYATSPGFSNPIGDAVAELRYRSPSLKDFVDRIGETRSAEELKKAAGG